MAAKMNIDAARRIRQLAALGNAGASGHAAQAEEEVDTEGIFAPGCSIRMLPDRLQVDAAGVAGAVNPVNLPPSLRGMAAAMPGRLNLSIVVSKYWAPGRRALTVSFMEAAPAALRDRIIRHMNAWGNCCGFDFKYTTGVGQVRVSLIGAGYWSYLGTDILLVPKNQPTMNLQGFSMMTPESEYKRVVRHETGHTMGFPHEHMRKELVARIDPPKAYRYFLATQGWSKKDVDLQVLTPLDEASLLGTPADQTSIMCYQLPATIMKDGKPIIGGTDINPTDCSFAGQVYPKPAKRAKPPKPPKKAPRAAGPSVLSMAAPAGGYEDHPRDWSRDDDVDPEALVAEVHKQRGPAG